MVENGFFCLFPNDATATILQSCCKEPHISILVINSPEEIKRMKECCSTNNLLAHPVEVKIKDKHSLFKRDGTKIDVLRVADEQCVTLKEKLISQFALVSDIYGALQSMHITLDSNCDLLFETRLIFDKCFFSSRVVMTSLKRKADIESLGDIVITRKGNTEFPSVITGGSATFVSTWDHNEDFSKTFVCTISNNKCGTKFTAGPKMHEKQTVRITQCEFPEICGPSEDDTILEIDQISKEFTIAQKGISGFKTIVDI